MTIESQLEDIFRTTFGAPELKLTREMSAGHLDGWDSLNHVRLIIAVERRFGVKIATKDLAQLKTVANFIDFLTERLQGEAPQ